MKVEYFVGLNNYADSILTLIGRGTNGIISSILLIIFKLSLTTEALKVMVCFQFIFKLMCC